jgi:hypothetical protein
MTGLTNLSQAETEIQKEKHKEDLKGKYLERKQWIPLN